jgi:hypothetical protein
MLFDDYFSSLISTVAYGSDGWRRMRAMHQAHVQVTNERLRKNIVIRLAVFGTLLCLVWLASLVVAHLYLGSLWIALIWFVLVAISAFVLLRQVWPEAGRDPFEADRLRVQNPKKYTFVVAIAMLLTFICWPVVMSVFLGLLLDTPEPEQIWVDGKICSPEQILGDSRYKYFLDFYEHLRLVYTVDMAPQGLVVLPPSEVLVLKAMIKVFESYPFKTLA